MNADNFVFNDQIRLPFQRIESDWVADEIAGINKFCCFPSNVIQVGFFVDWQVLNQQDLKLAKAGELPAGLIHYWASLAAAIMADESLFLSGIIIPHKRIFRPMETTGFISWLDTDDVDARPGVGFAIGIREPISWEPKWPVHLSGVIFPVLDRWGVVCQATDDVYRTLQQFLPPRDFSLK